MIGMNHWTVSPTDQAKIQPTVRNALYNALWDGYIPKRRLVGLQNLAAVAGANGADVKHDRVFTGQFRVEY